MNMSPRLSYNGNILIHPILFLQNFIQNNHFSINFGYSYEYIKPMDDWQTHSKTFYMCHVEDVFVNFIYEVR